MSARCAKPRKKRVFKPRPPRVDADLIARLQELMDAIGSNLAAAKAIGRSEGAVRKWLRAVSEPAASDIRRLCETSGFSAEWILFGTDLQGRCERENRILAGPERLLPVEIPKDTRLEAPAEVPDSNASGDTDMQTRRAREILDGLIQGIDPLTLRPLPEGTVLEKADVVRAMLVAVASLEQSLERDSRRRQLPKNIGRNWSEQENSKLLEAFRAGMPWKEIADQHGRTLRAIEARLEQMGLITAEQRTTQSRFGANSK
jgi:hypothetical protein